MSTPTTWPTALPRSIRSENFTSLNVPGAGTGANQGTFAGNVNPGGEIAGYWADANNVNHGFVSYPPYRNYTSFDPPGSVNTLHRGGYLPQPGRNGRGHVL